MCSLSVECHTMALVEIERKAYTLSPETEGVEIGLKLTAVGDRSNFRINFNVIRK